MKKIKIIKQNRIGVKESYLYNLSKRITHNLIHFNQRKKMENIKQVALEIIESTEEYSGRHPIFEFIKCFSDIEFNKNLFKLVTNQKDNVAYCYSYDDLFPIPYNYKTPEFIYKGDKLTRQEFLDNCLYKEGEEIEVKLGYDAIVNYTWNRYRFVDAMVNIGEGKKGGSWRQDPGNHFGQFFYPFGLSIIYNGNHSSTSGILSHEGIVAIKDVYDFTPLYSYLETDGVNYKRISDKSVYAPVLNFNMAAIFEIGRLIVEKGIKFDEVKRKQDTLERVES